MTTIAWKIPGVTGSVAVWGPHVPHENPMCNSGLNTSYDSWRANGVLSPILYCITGVAVHPTALGSTNILWSTIIQCTPQMIPVELQQMFIAVFWAAPASHVSLCCIEPRMVVSQHPTTIYFFDYSDNDVEEGPVAWVQRANLEVSLPLRVVRRILTTWIPGVTICNTLMMNSSVAGVVLEPHDKPMMVMTF